MLHQLRCQSLRLMIKDSFKYARKLPRKYFKTCHIYLYCINNVLVKIYDLVNRLNTSPDLSFITTYNCLSLTKIVNKNVFQKTFTFSWESQRKRELDIEVKLPCDCRITSNFIVVQSDSMEPFLGDGSKVQWIRRSKTKCSAWWILPRSASQ